jgi:hypothetical protein
MASAALKKKFDTAAADSKKLSARPDNATLLKIYSLYKQGSVGDNEEKKPSPTWWAAPSGTPGTSSKAPAKTRPCSSTWT